jgi:hypothetical protein
MAGAVVWLALGGAVVGGSGVGAGAAGQPAAPFSGAQVCSLVSRAEVYQLLNDTPATSLGTPQAVFGAPACAWGTGMGETVGVSVGSSSKRLLTHPCGRSAGTKIRVDAWSGCATVSYVSGESITGYEGRYGVAIEPQVSVIGIYYQRTEEAVISRIFQELHA